LLASDPGSPCSASFFIEKEAGVDCHRE